MNPNFGNLLELLNSARTKDKDNISNAVSLIPNHCVDNTLFQSEKKRILSVVYKQLLAQEEVESELANEYAKINDSIAGCEKEIQGAEIVGSSCDEYIARLKELTLKRTNYERYCYDRMNALRAMQQEIFQSEQVPCFKVTNDESEIAEQLWVLAPYLHAIRISQSKYNN